MSQAEHPANGAPPCRMPDCDQPAAARCTWISFPGRTHTFVNVQPLTGQGQPTCLDHVHHLVDVLLIRATPEPATTEEKRP